MSPKRIAWARAVRAGNGLHQYAQTRSTPPPRGVATSAAAGAARWAPTHLSSTRRSRACGHRSPDRRPPGRRWSCRGVRYPYAVRHLASAGRSTDLPVTRTAASRSSGCSRRIRRNCRSPRSPNSSASAGPIVYRLIRPLLEYRLVAKEAVGTDSALASWSWHVKRRRRSRFVAMPHLRSLSDDLGPDRDAHRQ